MKNKKSHLQLKIVSNDLQELNRLVREYEKFGFIDSDYSQEQDGIYWTFLNINNGLLPY